MNSLILETTTATILFACILLAIFLLTVKTNNKFANNFLGAYFIVFAIHISAFFYAKHIVLPVNVELFRDHIAFLSSPLIFLYFVSSIYSDFELRPRHVMHLIPFVLQVLLFSPRFYFANTESSELLLLNLNSTFEGKASIVFGLLVAFFYLVAIFLELKKYQRLLLENYANRSVFNYDWLYQLFVLLSAIFCLSVIKQVYIFFGVDIAVLNFLRILLTMALICFLSWIVLKSMNHLSLFRSINTKDLLVKDILDNETHGCENSQPDKEIAKLISFMQKQEPYLDPDLTILKLADMYGVSSRDLSLLINHHLDQHFFDFINDFRIIKSKKLLLENKKTKLTIQRIMFDVGFNSKSSFYTAFKKQVGITPSEYRKQQKNNQ